LAQAAKINLRLDVGRSGAPSKFDKLNARGHDPTILAFRKCSVLANDAPLPCVYAGGCDHAAEIESGLFRLLSGHPGDQDFTTSKLYRWLQNNQMRPPTPHTCSYYYLRFNLVETHNILVQSWSPASHRATKNISAHEPTVILLMLQLPSVG
jgi:hypothetical protein